ncbi:MAG TPA: hypothetical protein PKE03_01415 [Bacteroidales bacterium]|nr:hypothetical protein [Bacteroidales bacterium]
MEWIEILQALGFSAAGQILLLIVIGFFGKKLFEYFFSESLELKKTELNQELENYKQKLDSITNIHKLTLEKDLEKFKGELNKLAFEHQTKYLQLHTNRAESIKKLFGLLYELESKMQSLMKPYQGAGEKPISEKFQEALDAAEEFVRFYKSNEVLFNAKTCKLFDKINDSFLKAWKDFNISRQFRQSISTDLSQELIKKEMDAYYETLLKQIPVLKEELKDDFRNLLGVEKE